MDEQKKNNNNNNVNDKPEKDSSVIIIPPSKQEVYYNTGPNITGKRKLASTNIIAAAKKPGNWDPVMVDGIPFKKRKIGSEIILKESIQQMLKRTEINNNNNNNNNNNKHNNDIVIKIPKRKYRYAHVNGDSSSSEEDAVDKPLRKRGNPTVTYMINGLQHTPALQIRTAAAFQHLNTGSTASLERKMIIHSNNMGIAPEAVTAGILELCRFRLKRIGKGFGDAVHKGEDTSKYIGIYRAQAWDIIDTVAAMIDIPADQRYTSLMGAIQSLAREPTWGTGTGSTAQILQRNKGNIPPQSGKFQLRVVCNNMFYRKQCTEHPKSGICRKPGKKNNYNRNNNGRNNNNNNNTKNNTGKP